MDYQLILGLILTILPLSELRGGLPVILDYCLRNGLNIWPFFGLVILLNLAVIFFIYLFLDYIHKYLMYWKFYSRLFNKIIDKLRIKNKKFEKRFNELGYFALFIIIAIPLPGTGAWAGTLLAWILDLNRKKSILAISLGIMAAGLIILFFSLGILSLFYK
jgi:uncharacterized membrane protein